MRKILFFIVLLSLPLSVFAESENEQEQSIINPEWIAIGVTAIGIGVPAIWAGKSV